MLIPAVAARAFASLALLGLALSVASHVCSLLGVPGPLGDLTWLLHVGIFVVWLPAILVGKAMAGNASTPDIWKKLLSGCPRVLRTALFALLAYAFVNFFISMASDTTVASPDGGSMQPPVVRTFSGHWMAFYSVGFCLLRSYLSFLRTPPTAVCTAGHAFPAIHTACPTCGAQIATKPLSPPAPDAV